MFIQVVSGQFSNNLSWNLLKIHSLCLPGIFFNNSLEVVVESVHGILFAEIVGIIPEAICKLISKEALGLPKYIIDTCHSL